MGIFNINNTDSIISGNHTITVDGEVVYTNVNDTGIIKGNGQYTHQDMTSLLAHETLELDVSSSFEVILNIHPDNTPKLIVKAEKNIISQLDFSNIYHEKNDSNTLKISPNSGFSTTKSIIIELTLPRLNYIYLSGASQIKGHFKGSKLNISLSGASEIQLDGIVEVLDIDASGSTKAKMKNLQANEIVVNTSGASTVGVCAIKNLTGKASGASTVSSNGNPDYSHVKCSGAADFKAKNSVLKTSNELKPHSHIMEPSNIKESEYNSKKSVNKEVENKKISFKEKIKRFL